MIRRVPADLAIAVALAAVAILFWYFRLILPAHQMHAGSGDLYTQIYPMVHRANELLRHGQVPLWNPYQLAGQPFHASVLYGLFYPFNIPSLLFSTAVALELIAIEHLFLSGCFTYAYGRTVGLSRLAASFAAVGFMLSGYVAAQALWFTPAIGAIVWFPFALTAVERLFRQPRISDAALLAIGVAMPILAGWLQVWVYAMHAVAVYAVARLAIEWRRGHRASAYRACLLFAAGIIAGLALAAVQLLPSAELQSLGPRRPGGLTLQQTLTLGPLAPQALLAHVLDSQPGFPRLEYVGIVTLLLAAISLLTSSRHRVHMIVLWLLLALGVALALTVFTPLFQYYRMVPGGSWFRIPWRIIFLATFAATVLSGVGLDTVREMAATRSRACIGLAVLLSALVASLIAGVDMPVRSRVYFVIGDVLIVCLLLVQSPRVRTLSAAGLLALLCIDLFTMTRSPAQHPFHDLTPFDAERESLDYVRQHQNLYRSYFYWPLPGNPAMMPKQGTLSGIYSITDYEPLSLERYARFYALLDTSRVSEDDPQRVPFIGFLNLAPSHDALRLLSLLSVRFVVPHRMPGELTKALQGDGWRTVFVPQHGQFTVMENPSPIPRAYVAYEVIGVRDARDALSVVAHPTFDPRHSVVIEGITDVGGPAMSIAAADILRYEPDRVDIRAAAKAPGYLILTDVFYPGWQAAIDGHAVAIERANYLFRAVHIPAGVHEVTFFYRPTSFRAGVAISLTAALVVAAAVMIERRSLRGAKRPD